MPPYINVLNGFVRYRRNQRIICPLCKQSNALRAHQKEWDLLSASSPEYFGHAKLLTPSFHKDKCKLAKLAVMPMHFPTFGNPTIPAFKPMLSTPLNLHYFTLFSCFLQEKKRKSSFNRLGVFREWQQQK